MKELTLNQKELARQQVLINVLEHWLPMDRTAHRLGVTERHAWRILAAYDKGGAAALAQGSKGPRPLNATSAELAEAVVNLARTHYPGSYHTHLTDLLRERGHRPRPADCAPHTRQGGPPQSQRRRSQQHDHWRRCMPQEGTVVKIDSSEHPWLADRGPHFLLMLPVDDATGEVAMRGTPRLHHADGRADPELGIPLALYTNRHGVFKNNCRWKPLTVTPFGLLGGAGAGASSGYTPCPRRPRDG